MADLQLATERMKNLHLSIGTADERILQNVIKDFSMKHPEETYVFNENGKSAAFIALKLGKIRAYEVLIHNGFCLGSEEKNEEIWREYQSPTRNVSDFEKFKIYLRQIRNYYFRNTSIRYLNILSAKSKIKYCQTDQELRNYYGIIDNALEDLNEIEEIAPLLKVAATSENLEIIFYFEKDSLGSEGNGQIVGRTSHNGRIEIAALPFLSENTKNDVLGTLAHELCHFAMLLVYNNNFKPYATNSAKLESFKEIEKHCHRHRSSDVIINAVYHYHISKQHAELIVRPPHMMASYKRSGALENAKLRYQKLFQLYSTAVMDVKLKLARDNISSILETLKLSCKELITLLDNPKTPETEDEREKFIGLRAILSNECSRLTKEASDCPQLTIVSIYKELRLEENLYSFPKLEEFLKIEIGNMGKLLTLLQKLINCNIHDKARIVKIAGKILVSIRTSELFHGRLSLGNRLS